jgi:hypothetical protein
MLIVLLETMLAVFLFAGILAGQREPGKGAAAA